MDTRNMWKIAAMLVVLMAFGIPTALAMTGVQQAVPGWQGAVAALAIAIATLIPAVNILGRMLDGWHYAGQRRAG